MKLGTLFFTVILTASTFAAVPDVVLDFKNSYNGYGTFAGHLTSTPTAPVGITVDNGGLKFSTIADKDGNWAISFRQRVVMSDITAWSFSNANDASDPLRVRSE